MRPTKLLLCWFLAAYLTQEAFSCFGAPACAGGAGCAGSPVAAAAVARTRALAAPHHRDPIQRATQCHNVGIYHADELRGQASLYGFTTGNPTKSVEDGALLSCNFDSDEEICAWYSVDTASTLTTGVGNALDASDSSLATTQTSSFQRARFESFFDVRKFDCTHERAFPFDDYFLLAGGDYYSTKEGAAAIEARIPCQFQKGVLKFNYWSNNETPVLKICILLEENLSPQCEEAQLDVNPLTFEIPQSLSPFRLRILVENIGREDIVLIDSIAYQGNICQPHFASAAASPAASSLPVNAITDERLLNELSVRRNPISEDGPLVHLVHSHITNKKSTEEPGGKNVSKLELHDGRQFKPAEVTVEPDTDPNELNLLLQTKRTTPAQYRSIIKPSKDKGPASAYNIACHALACDFSSNSACGYQLAGLNFTGRWRLSGVAVGNPHTGIHRANPNDKVKSSDGFAYVGVDDIDVPDQTFVLASPSFVLTKPAFLVFDFFQRSLGPELKVCINNRKNCPYTNPPLTNSRHWHINQHVLLNQTSNNVYFIASKLRRNQYLGVDNIRLIDIGGLNDCASES